MNVENSEANVRIMEMLVSLGLPCHFYDIKNVETYYWDDITNNELEQICSGSYLINKNKKYYNGVEMILATIVNNKNIYGILESINKIGATVYIRDWDFYNLGDDIIIIERGFRVTRENKALSFSVSVENSVFYTERALKEDFRFVSNDTFIEELEESLPF